MSIKLEDVCRHLSQLQITNNKDDIARLQPRVIKYPQRAYRKREQKRDGGVAIRQTLHVPTYTQVHL